MPQCHLAPHTVYLYSHTRDMQYHIHNIRKYLLLYHVIVVVKYRKKLLQGSVTGSLKDSLQRIEAISELSIPEMEVDQNHLHMMLDISSNVSIAQTVRRLKQTTTQDLWCDHLCLLRQNFWKERTF